MRRTLPSLASWVPGASEGVAPTRALISEFLLATESLPAGEAARIAGISLQTLHKWRLGLVRSVAVRNKRRIHLYLAGRSAR